jgi:S-adenosylmethionine-dependent methyltransferase
MSIFDLEKLHLFGSESFLSMREAELKKEPADVVNAWLDVAEKISERKDMLSFTHHIMYVGRKL